MDEEKLSKFVKLPTFDGDEEKFQLWFHRHSGTTSGSVHETTALGPVPQASKGDLQVVTCTLDPRECDILGHS